MFFVCEGHDGSGGVFTDAREFSEFIECGGDFIVVIAGDDGGSFMESDGAARITKSSPGFNEI